MRTLILEAQENCGEKTCDDCRWVYGEEEPGEEGEE